MSELPGGQDDGIMENHETTVTTNPEQDLAEVDAQIACFASRIDSGSRNLWPKDGVLERAVSRHEARVQAERRMMDKS